MTVLLSPHLRTPPPPSGGDPIAVRLLTTETGSAASFASSSFTPAANSLLVAWGCLSGDGRVTSFTGGGLSWTRRAEANGGGTTWYGRAAIFTAPVTASASMTATINISQGAPQGGAAFAIAEVANYNAASPIGGTHEFWTSSAQSGPYSGTLSAAPVASDLVIAGALAEFNTDGDTNVEPGVGWTSLHVKRGGSGDFTEYAFQARTGAASDAVEFAQYDAYGGYGHGVCALIINGA